MNLERKISCVISGSFDKTKPEIDKAINDFKQLGVDVLAPEEGWLILPSWKRNSHFRPLPSEVNMAIKEIEERHLAAIDRSDFLYIVSPNGYVGLSTSFEIGRAIARDKPIFADHQLSAIADGEDLWIEVSSEIPVLDPQGVVIEMHHRLFQS